MQKLQEKPEVLQKPSEAIEMQKQPAKQKQVHPLRKRVLKSKSKLENDDDLNKL